MLNKEIDENSKANLKSLDKAKNDEVKCGCTYTGAFGIKQLLWVESEVSRFPSLGKKKIHK